MLAPLMHDLPAATTSCKGDPEATCDLIHYQQLQYQAHGPHGLPEQLEFGGATPKVRRDCSVHMRCDLLFRQCS